MKELYSNSDEEFLSFLKKVSGKGDFEKNKVKHRFLNSKYTVQLSPLKKQNVVIKIINKGAGGSHLSKLIQYISREGEDKDNEHVALYDKNGEELSGEEIKELKKIWSEDFSEWDISEDLKNDIAEVETLKNVLDELYWEKGLNEEQGMMYSELKKINYKSSLPDIRENALIKDISNGEIGFLRFDKGESYIRKVDKNGDVFQKIIKEEDTKFLAKEMKDHSNSKPKDFSHMMLSTGGNQPDKDTALQATQDFLEKTLRSKGFDYMLAMHDDTKNLHFHVVVNNKSKQNIQERGKRAQTLNLNKFDLQIMREEYTKSLDGYGINRYATLKMDRADFLKRKERDLKNATTHDKSWYGFQLSRTDNSAFDALKFRKKAIGTLDKLSVYFDQKENKEMAKLAKKERDIYLKIEPEQIKKALDNTINVLELDGKDLEKTIGDSFKKEIGSPSDYQRREEVHNKVLDDYKDHLNSIIDNLDELPKAHITPKLDKQITFTRDYVATRLNEVSVFLQEGKVLEKSMEKD